MADEELDELVILVHGTFAGDKDRRDEGERWWQRGSPTWRALAAELPPGAGLPDGVGAFHWSGANAQSERLEGGTDLLALLMGLEQQGRSYHLVGHSHGGSVIWEALISAHLTVRAGKLSRTLQNRLPKSGRHVDSLDRPVPLAELTGLRSVTTVGTPFLHFLPEGGRRSRGWGHPRFGLVADPGQVGTGGCLAAVLLLAAMAAAVLGPPAMAVEWVLWMLGVVVPFGPTIWTIVGGVVSLPMLIDLQNRSSFKAAMTNRAKAARAVFEQYADRWLGLWAADDEAVALLQGVAGSDRPPYAWLWQNPAVREPWKPAEQEVLAQRIPVRIGNPTTLPDTSLWKVSHLARPLVRTAFNRWLGPRISATISRILLHATQGNDLPGTRLCYAAPWPLPLDHLPPGLPEPLAERLTIHANARSAQLAPALRRIIAQAALDGVSLPQAAIGVQRPRTDGALVHTAYFDDPELLRLIALHIGRTMAEPRKAPEEDRHLSAWLEANTEAVRQRLATFREAVDLRPRAEPR